MVLPQHDFHPMTKSSLLHESFSRYAITTPDSFHEPDDALPYGSTPLDPYRRGVWHGERDGSTRSSLRFLYESPPDDLALSKNAKRVIAADFDAGMTAREMRNYDKYWLWRAGHEQEFNNLVQYGFWRDLKDRAETGKASPDDLINLMQHSSLHAITLASLSMPYGYRAEQYPKMMGAIEKAITDYGGEVCTPEQREVYSIGDFARHYHIEQVSGPTGQYIPNAMPWMQQRQLANETHFSQGDLEAILVTYKRKVGRFTTDRTDMKETVCDVRERLSAVIVCDEKLGFPAALRDGLQGDENSPEYQSAHEYITEHVIKSNEPIPYCLPLSSCVYAARNEKEPAVPMAAMQRAMAQCAATLAKEN